MVANARGSNRDSVVEWAVFMALSLLRRFPDYVNADRELRFERGESLVGKDVCVIGAGDIGSHLGKCWRRWARRCVTSAATTS